MYRRKRGKATISEQSPQNLPDDKSKTKSNEVLKPIVLLSLLIGYAPRHFRIRGIFGGILWLISLVFNGAFGFLSARKTYGYAWASIQILLFISLMMCTLSARRNTLPCLEFGIVQLEGEKKYLKTFARIRKLFRIIPWVIIVFSLCSTGMLYFCFHYDNAFSVSFEQKVSERWNSLLHVFWFLTNTHTLYGFALFWCIGMCNMYVLGYSMTEYHEIMTAHLKNKDTPITFRQAVHSFAERGRYLKKFASACRVPLAFLLVYSIASLAVNAFYYLYKMRKAAYIFYALMPPICSVYPLCLAAWVTKQYKWYLAVVVKAWAERPESTDEESESEHVQSVKDKRKAIVRKFTKRAKSARNKKDADDMVVNRRRSLFSPHHTHSKPVPLGLHSDTELNQVGKSLDNSGKHNPGLWNRIHYPLRLTKSNPISARSYSDIENQDGKIIHHPADMKPTFKSSVKTTVTSTSDTENATGDLYDKKLPGHQNSKSMVTLGHNDERHSKNEDKIETDDEGKSSANESDSKNTKSGVSRQRVMELILRGTARAVGRLKHRAKMPKFNFEKYISYLQNVIPGIGFRIMGIIVTWNMVSTLLFLEVSLLALFVQESIFGNQNAQVSL